MNLEDIADTNIELNFDQYQRYRVVSDIINKFRTDETKFRILEVGAGLEKNLKRFLPKDDIYFLDKEYPQEYNESNKYIVSDILEIELKDTYDFVVSIDTYEHIPQQAREEFIDKLLDTSRIATIIAAPFNTPGVEIHEALANVIYKSSHSTEHIWLKEHIQNKLPSLQHTLESIEKKGYNFSVIPNGYLPRWFKMISIYMLAEGSNDCSKMINHLQKFYNSRFYEYDNQSPAYRHVIVVDKTSLLKDYSSILAKNAYPDQIKFKEELLDILIYQAKEIYSLLKLKELAETADKTQIAVLSEQLRQANSQGAAFRQEIDNMKRSIVWQVVTKFHECFVEKALPQGSKQRSWYDLGLKGGRILVNSGPLEFYQNFQNWFIGRKNKQDKYELWIQNNEPKENELETMKIESRSFLYRPKISIITPAWNTDEIWLRTAIESVRAQIYDNWELCIVDGGSTKPRVKNVLEEYAKKDNRIKIELLNENKGISRNSNEALSLADGEFVGLMDHDDELAPFALYEVAKILNDKPELDFIYSDEDKIDDKGKRKEPFFKPDWSPDMFLSFNYIVHFAVVRKSLINKIQGFKEDYDGAQDYDLFLRFLEHIEESKIAHIQKILYHWRTLTTSAAASTIAKPYAYIAGNNALRDAMTRRGIEVLDVCEGLFLGSYRIKYKIVKNPKVSIIVPTKDKVNILSRCINSILTETIYPNYDIIIVDNNSRDDETFRYYDSIKDNKKIKILYYNKEFNYSAINNFAVSQTDSEYIVFLNNDTEVISDEWLSALLEHAQRGEVGVVGAKLIFPNNMIQHCGVILGWGPDKVAGHYYYRHPDHHGYFGTIDVIRNYSAVTGACMMTRKSLFEEVDGFDERNLAIAFNDIDYCLKLRERGYLIVYTPYAKLYHYESLSRGYEDTPEKQMRFLQEAKYIRDKFGHIIDKGDPYYNINQAQI